MGFSHITIMGGGLSGLILAWKLQQAGIQTLVLEEQAQIGGLAKSLREQGFRLDIGPERFVTSEQPILDEMKLLMGGTQQVALRPSRVWFEGRFVDYPLTTRSLFQIPFSTLLQAASGFFESQIHTALRGEPSTSDGPSPKSPKDGAKRSPTTKEEEIAALLDQLLMSEKLEGLWQKAPSFLSPSWSSSPKGREETPSLADRLRSLFRTPTPYSRSFHSPGEGFGSIAQRLQIQLLALGGEIRTHARIRRILAPDGEVKAIHFCDPSGEHRLPTSYLFSTIPLPTLFSLLDPLPPHSLLEAAFQLRYQSLLKLQILLERPKAETEAVFFFPGGKMPFFRASYASPPAALPASKKDHHLLVVDCLFPSDSPMLDSDPLALLRLCLPGLQEAGLAFPKEIRETSVHKEVFALPTDEPRHQEGLRSLHAYLTGLRRLRAIGMQSAFQVWNLHQVIRSALQAARSILDETSARRPAYLPSLPPSSSLP